MTTLSRAVARPFSYVVCPVEVISIGPFSGVFIPCTKPALANRPASKKTSSRMVNAKGTAANCPCKGKTACNAGNTAAGRRLQACRAWTFLIQLQRGAGGARRIACSARGARKALPRLLAPHLLLCAAKGPSAGRSAGSYARFLCPSVGAAGSAQCAQRKGTITFVSAHGGEALSGR